MLQPHDITDHFINTLIQQGDTAIDATCGNGNDTLKLCRAVGNQGKVYAFDIQKDALFNTRKKLEENGIYNTQYIEDCHSKLDKYVLSPVKAVIFNLGYLPGGDHSIHTRAETTIKAIEKSIDLIEEDGFISVTVYYGQNSGTEEKDAVMEYFRNIDYKRCTVTVHDFINRPNNPPITVIITK